MGEENNGVGVEVGKQWGKLNRELGRRCRWSVSDEKGGNGSIWGVGFRNRRQE